VRIVIDSSVWISALQFGGTPEKAVALAARIDDIVTCDHIDREIRRHLAAKFDWAPAEIEAALGAAWERTIWVATTGSITGILPRPRRRSHR
jgi:hypothetical protein